MKKLALVIAIMFSVLNVLTFSACSSTKISTPNKSENVLNSWQENEILSSISMDENGNYLVYTKEDFKNVFIGSNYGKKIKLCNNITFNAEEIWTPIKGDGELVFDGQGYKITGLQTKKTNTFGGLFEQLDDGSVVKNLIIEDATINSKYSSSAIVGSLIEGQIENCTIINSTINTYYNNTSYYYGLNTNWGTTEDYVYAGAIAGKMNNSTINNCITINTNVNIMDDSENISSFDDERIAKAGGIVGAVEDDSDENKEPSSINYCMTSGVVKSAYYTKEPSHEIKLTKAYAGGIVGYNIAKINGCQNNSEVYAGHCLTGVFALISDSYAGGVAGYSEGEITNCANFGYICAQSNYFELMGSSELLSNNILLSSDEKNSLSEKAYAPQEEEHIDCKDLYTKWEFVDYSLKTEVAYRLSNNYVHYDFLMVPPKESILNPYGQWNNNPSKDGDTTNNYTYRYSLNFTEDPNNYYYSQANSYAGGIVGFVSSGSIVANSYSITTHVLGGYRFVLYKPYVTLWVLNAGSSGISTRIPKLQLFASPIAGNEILLDNFDNEKNYRTQTGMIGVSMDIATNGHMGFSFANELNIHDWNRSVVDSSKINANTFNKDNSQYRMSSVYNSLYCQNCKQTRYQSLSWATIDNISMKYENETLNWDIEVCYKNYYYNENDNMVLLSDLARINHVGSFTHYKINDIYSKSSISSAKRIYNNDKDAVANAMGDEWSTDPNINNGYPYIKGLFH